MRGWNAPTHSEASSGVIAYGTFMPSSATSIPARARTSGVHSVSPET